MANRRAAGLVLAAVGAALLSGCIHRDDTESTAVADTTTAPVDAVGALPVIVDYSPTVSDIPALLFLLQHPDVEVLAVTLAGTGEAHCESGVETTLGLLELTGHAGVPVACGPEQPIGPGNRWPAEFRTAADDVPGLDFAPLSGAMRTDAPDLLAEVASAVGRPVTIVALGPLTNLAAAVDRHPDLVDDVEMLYTMGGALDVAGNTPDGGAEWNYFVDPTAVDRVVRSGLPVTMVALDATNDVPNTDMWFARLARHHVTPAASAVHDLFAAARPFELGGMYFWDELTAAAAVDESLVTIETRRLVVELTGTAMGRTRPDETGSEVRVAVAADRERFEAVLLTTLNGGVAADALVASDAEAGYFDSFQQAATALESDLGTLFTTPLAQEVEAVLGDEVSEIDPAAEPVVRQFVIEFWGGAMLFLRGHGDVVRAIDVPETLQGPHRAYLSALDALVATGDQLLAAAETQEIEELLGEFWTPTPEMLAFEEACGALELEAAVRAIEAKLCFD